MPILQGSKAQVTFLLNDAGIKNYIQTYTYTADFPSEDCLHIHPDESLQAPARRRRRCFLLLIVMILRPSLAFLSIQHSSH